MLTGDVLSLLLFFRLLPKWRFLRRFLRYKNTPTSNLNSLAVGNVQVNGKIVKPDNILHSPIHNAECVYYDSYVEVRLELGFFNRLLNGFKGII